MENTMQELVSIITPTYNASKHVLETIKSVKMQTYQNWEMLVIDDASTDNTAETIIHEIRGDARFKFIQLNENSGPAVARNKGISSANGQFIAFLDSDDVWHPEKLERQLRFMKENNIAFSYTAYRMIDEEGNILKNAINVPRTMNYHSLLKDTKIGTLTVMIDKRVIGMVQMPEYRDCSEDYGLWLKILSGGIIAHGLNEELAFYRKCEKSLSSNKLKSARKTWNTYRKVEKLPVSYSIFCFIHYSINAFKKHKKV